MHSFKPYTLDELIFFDTLSTLLFEGNVRTLKTVTKFEVTFIFHSDVQPKSSLISVIDKAAGLTPTTNSISYTFVTTKIPDKKLTELNIHVYFMLKMLCQIFGRFYPQKLI